MNLLYCFFDAANMHRWNDHLCPIDLTELDKQSHKVAIAWMLGKFEESEGNKIDWRKLIEHSMFSFIQRLILTDLKPQLFHRIIEERSKELNAFVMSEFDRLVPDCNEALRSRLSEYLSADKSTKEDEIISAGHYLATNWEFRLIRDMNRSLYGIDQTEKDIESQLFVHSHLHGFKEMFKRTSFSFMDLFGQLRFQQRWARTPRIPKTTVLGHMLMVANMVYLNDLDKGADDTEVYNDFFRALFHDLPEVLTKDVISPVKNSIGGLNQLLEDYERELVESRIMPLLPKEWHDEVRSIIYDPFGSHPGGRSGYDIKTCDMLAAYMEADMSIRYGIGSKSLREARDDLRASLISRKGVDTRGLIDAFDRMNV